MLSFMDAGRFICCMDTENDIVMGVVRNPMMYDGGGVRLPWGGNISFSDQSSAVSKN